MIAVSFTFRDRLTGNISNSTTLTDTSTQSGKGQQIYKERFNLTSNTATQVLIIELNNQSLNIQSNQWRNFTLYLTLYLNQTYFNRNYTSIVSEPLALLGGYNDLASTMVSKDHQDGLIYMSGPQDQLDFKKDVKDIRTQMKDIIANPQSLFNFANLTTYELLNFINFVCIS